MYHCHIHFYFAGHTCRVLDIMKEASPLEHFTHTFSESDGVETALTAEADVIVADLRAADAGETLAQLFSGMRENAQLIVLAEKEQAGRLAEDMGERIHDIWILPMSDGEIRFRFRRWQEAYKRDWEGWETGQFLDATINNVPNLIWYKDKKGIHKKVNDSFCRTVNKTKEQVEGRGHAYIWDVETDDPACIESERIVMESRKTCVSEETVKAGEGTRLLTTYKSPLYDVDGSVMGTVGVAIDVTQERAYEQEIIQKNRTLEAIFKSIDCGVLCHTVDGTRILSINRAALKILGYESQEQLEKDGFDM